MQVGSEVRGNNSRSGADGKSQDKAFVFRYPYASAAELWFKVTVVVGTTRSDASMVAPQSSDGVVVGKMCSRSSSMGCDRSPQAG